MTMLRLAAQRLVLLAGLWTGCAHAGGALVLMFDDDCRNWLAVAAPALAAVGGRATAYVNNECVHRGEASFADLRLLRDRYGWEIGTHTYHHQDAPRLAERIGVDAWLARELDAALKELRAQDLSPRSLAFPFNRFTPGLLAAARTRVESVRAVSRFPVTAGLAPDGTFPAAPIDMNHHVPAALLRQWVDLAASRGHNLYLYAHSIAPDTDFASGKVVEVEPYRITAARPLGPVATGQACIVADVKRRMSNTIKLDRVDGSRVFAAKGDLRRLTAPGAEFFIGPCYSTRASDFRELVEYARTRLRFETVSGSLANSTR